MNRTLPRAAFTRVELLTVVTMTVLAAGWLAWAAKGRHALHKESRRAACVAQIKELGQAFLICAQTQERLPRSAGLGRMATNDWIFWQTNRLLADSALAQFHQDFSARALRCPQDPDVTQRPYAYSYTMNEHLSQRRMLREGPCGIIVVAEEQFANDGSWAPGNPHDALASRHDGLANVAFGDGHVQQVPPRAPIPYPPRPAPLPLPPPPAFPSGVESFDRR